MSGHGKGTDSWFRILLSSTFEDLIEHRERVAEAIESLEQRPLRMETWVAEPRTPLAMCRDKAAAADAVVVCVAHRYGWVPSVDDGGDAEKSVTWHEVEVALDAGSPACRGPASRGPGRCRPALARR